MKQALTDEQTYWAYEKWCAGYTLPQIAAALYCSDGTLRRSLDRRGLYNRELPALKYEAANG